MEKKKLKLTISGNSKKTIDNIELAKSKGKNSVVIGKCHIREGCTIGSLSFVKTDLKKWSVYAGNPVKFIKVRKS